MCNPALAVMGASAIVGFGAAKNQAKAQQTSLLTDAMASDRNAVTADNAALVNENNADLAAWQSRDSLRIGESNVADLMEQRNIALAGTREETAATRSRQKVSFAANGIDIGQGSAANVIESTDYIGAVNEQNIVDAANRNADNIRDNAIKTAWGYDVQATNYQNAAAVSRADAALYRDDAKRQRGGAKAISPNTAGLTSLLGSAGQVASSWYNYSKAKG